MPFTINTRVDFAASHQLRLYDGAWEALHGHTWRVKVTVGSAGLDAIGVVMDFHELSRRVEEIVRPWRGKRLNDVPPFTADNPSAENVALEIGRRLALPPGITLATVEVWETAENSAVYSPADR